MTDEGGSSIDRRTIEEATRSVLRQAGPDISEYQLRMAVSDKVGIQLLNPKYKAIVFEVMDSFDWKESRRDVFSCDLSGNAQVLVQHIGNDTPCAILWIRKFKNADEEQHQHPCKGIRTSMTKGKQSSSDADPLCHPSEETSITSEEWMLLKRNVASINRAARKAAHSLRKWGHL